MSSIAKDGETSMLAASVACNANRARSFSFVQRSRFFSFVIFLFFNKEIKNKDVCMLMATLLAWPVSVWALIQTRPSS